RRRSRLSESEKLSQRFEYAISGLSQFFFFRILSDQQRPSLFNDPTDRCHQFGIRLEERTQRRLFDLDDFRLLRRDDGRGPRLTGQQTHLTEEVVRPQIVYCLLMIQLRDLYFHFTAHDDEHRVAFLTATHDRLARRINARRRRLRKTLDFLFREWHE